MADRSPLLGRSPSRRGVFLGQRLGTWKKELVVVSGPLGMVLVMNFVEIKEGPKAAHMLGALLWLGLWWILEPVPLCVTALVPLVLFPALRIMDANEVAQQYANDTVTLMLGTFILALAIQRFNLHKRIALRILLFFGGKSMDPRLVLLGFCAGPAFVSMWMSNTAAAIMMIPMATGVLKPFDVDDPDPSLCRSCSRTYSQKHLTIPESDIVDDPEALAKHQASLAADAKKNFCKGVILAIVYGTAVGGLATITGCGPNLVLPGIYSGRFPKAPPVGYFQWMLFAMPIAVPYLIFLWLMLCYFYCPASSVETIKARFSRQLVEREYQNLGNCASFITTLESFFFSFGSFFFSFGSLTKLMLVLSTLFAYPVIACIGTRCEMPQHLLLLTLVICMQAV
jgi:sodium-dependent dicarboxylate transporter 2/3/5